MCAFISLICLDVILPLHFSVSVSLHQCNALIPNLSICHNNSFSFIFFNHSWLYITHRPIDSNSIYCVGVFLLLLLIELLYYTDTFPHSLYLSYVPFCALFIFHCTTNNTHTPLTIPNKAKKMATKANLI